MLPAIKSKVDSPRSPVPIKRGSKQSKPHTDGVVSIPVDDSLHDPTFYTAEYPLDWSARASFRTGDGKRVTEHQWAVYDFTRKIPRGRVTTYGALCKALGKGSPRSVGSALRRNPFAPFVPCHRVIASNLYIGGFFGEWGKSSSGKNGVSGSKCQRKTEMLAMEGVEFTSDGYLANEKLVWSK